MSGNGTGHFKQQRLTAMANVPLVLFLLWFIITHLGASRADMLASLDHPLVAGPLVFAMVCFLSHMRLGMQVIIEDYVQGDTAFRTCMFLNTLFVGALGIVAVLAIAKMSLGY
jgi:succinate dehydrogenase / fumarate reductase, membrane anchor subunit